MVEHELGLAASFSVLEFEEFASALGLAVKRMSLATYPGSVHWHFSKPGARGVLEATWIPGKRLWLSVHGNRRADWQTEIIRQLSDWPKQ